MWKGANQMRKWKVVLSLLMVLIFISSPGLAAKKNSSIMVSMDGKKHKVTEVPVVMDGQSIYSDIPTFIHKDYTFVPIRFISEQYGAKVTWDQKTKTATVTQKDREIKMTINSKDVYISGKKKALDNGIAPKLVTFSNNDSRTMVPLRFISETLGYEVGWDNSNRVPFINTSSKIDNDKDTNTNTNAREITNVAIEKGSTNKPKVIINGTKNLSYSTVLLENPKRLIIDIEDAILNVKDGVGNIDVNSSPINKVSVSQFSTKPDVVRIVVNLTDKTDFDIVTGDDGKTLTLSFVSKVGKIVKEVIDDKEALVIYTEDKPETKVIRLNNPERIVVDLLDSSLEGANYFEHNYDIGFIKGVRVSQFVPDNLYKPNDRIVRVVLDVKDGVSDSNVKIDTYNNRIVIMPETSIWEVINYSLEGANRTVSIKANKETNYNVEYDGNRKSMTIDIPSENMDLQEGFVSIMDGLINDITMKKIGDSTKVIITFRRGAEHKVLSKDKDNKITISLKRDQNIKPSDRLIVIDPGHGGKDPGAVSPSGTREKDINISVSQKLNEGLKDKGYTTVMTRDDDIFVGLYERPNIANNNQADIFISIHANAHSNKDIDGIQVLYNPEGKDIESYPLAELIMDELIKGTGAKDRGIIKRPRLVVLNKTSMPAVLIEVGFLTNSDEEKLITDESYQDKIVNSIITAIDKYFEIY